MKVILSTCWFHERSLAVNNPKSLYILTHSKVDLQCYDSPANGDFFLVVRMILHFLVLIFILFILHQSDVLSMSL